MLPAHHHKSSHRKERCRTYQSKPPEPSINRIRSVLGERLTLLLRPALGSVLLVGGCVGLRAVGGDRFCLRLVRGDGLGHLLSLGLDLKFFASACDSMEGTSGGVLGRVMPQGCRHRRRCLQAETSDRHGRPGCYVPRSSQSKTGCTLSPQMGMERVSRCKTCMSCTI